MNAVFLDTVGLLATWDSADQWHGAAHQAYQRMRSERAAVITSSFILVERHDDHIARRLRRFREEMEATGRVIVPTDADWRLVWSDYARGNAGDAGIVDHISFVVMRRLGIRDAFSNDRHFKTAGFKTLF